MSSTTLESIKEIVKNKSVLVVSILLVISFILILQRESVPKALLYTFLLSIIVIIISIIIARLYKKEKTIELETLNQEIQLEKTRKDIKDKEIIKASLEKYNPDLSQFFKILNEKGERFLEDLEKEALKTKKKVYFIIESGEKLPEAIKKKLTGGILFTSFMQNINPEYKVFRINIYGTSSFIIFAEEEISPEELISSYYKYVRDIYDRLIKEDLLNDDEKISFRNWYGGLLKLNKPLILITRPYALSIVSLVELLYGRINKKEYSKLLSEIVSMTKQKTRVFKIKMVYLLESVGFDKVIIDKFINIEEPLKNKLKGEYIDEEANLYNLFHKRDFLNTFNKALEEIDKKFYDKVSMDGKYKRLNNLITSIQMNIFGVN